MPEFARRNFRAGNGRNQPVAPAILNQDNRATEETVWLERTFERKRLFEITGLVAHPMYPVPKFLWLRKHRPDVVAPSVRFVSVIGYVLRDSGYPLISIILWPPVIWHSIYGSAAGPKKFLPPQK